MKSKNKKEFELFKESLGEAVKVAHGKPANVKVETLMVKIGAEDIKEARRILKVSQPQFAGLMMVSPETVKKWEQGKNPIPASVGYWAAGLKTRPNVTKKLLLELAGSMRRTVYRPAGEKVLAAREPKTAYCSKARMDKKAVKKMKLGEETSRHDLSYWMSRPVEERIEAVEMLRKERYGSASRLQGIVRVIKPA
jgi:DNA-binding transcriptional regulator YiaG